MRSLPSASWISVYSRTGPSRKRSSVLCASDSPPTAGSSTSCFKPSESRLGSRPFASFDGSGGISRGASEHVAALDSQPVLVEGAEDGVRLALLGADVAELIDRVEPGVVDRFDPRRLERRAAELPSLAAERADLAREVDRPRRRSPSRSSELPLGLAVADRRRPEPRSRSSESSSARHSSRNCVRGPDSWRPWSRRSSKQKTGMTRSWRSSAARRAGWSRTRRSRRNQTMPVPLPATSRTYPRALRLKRATMATRICGRVEHVRAKELTRPRGVPAPAAVDERLATPTAGRPGSGSSHSEQMSDP